jgi:hypothetical protein
MFVSILVNTNRAAQLEEVIRAFRAIPATSRELEIRKSGSRYIYFLFKADNVTPFLEFARSLSRNHELLKSDIEFAWDDGVFHQGNVTDGEYVTESDRGTGRSSAWIFLEHFTGIEDNPGKVHTVWDAEVHPTPAESRKKKEDLERGKADWDAAFEADMERRRKRESSDKEELSPGADEPLPSKAALPKTRRQITEEIERINRSGLALIPFAVFPTELSKTLNPTGLSAFASYFDKSEEKGQIFGLVKKAFQKYREP